MATTSYFFFHFIYILLCYWLWVSFLKEKKWWNTHAIGLFSHVKIFVTTDICTWKIVTFYKLRITKSYDLHLRGFVSSSLKFCTFGGFLKKNYHVIYSERNIVWSLVHVTGCSINIFCFCFATSPSPALGCYWLYKKNASQ